MENPPFGSALLDPAVQGAMRGLGGGGGQPGQPGGQSGSQLYIAKNALNGGELAPQLGARFDQPRWQSGCHTLLNMVPLPQGGITKRPGMACIGVSHGAGEPGASRSRFIPFVFARNECLVLEFTSLDHSCSMNVFSLDGALIARDAARMPYGMWELKDISFAQSADVVYLAHPAHAPAKLCRYGNASWSYEVIEWMPGIAAPGITAVRTVGSIPSSEKSRSHYEYVATAIDATTGEESLASGVARIENAAPLSQTYFVELTLSAVANAAEYRVYKKRGGVFGYIGTVDPQGGALSFEDRNIEADIEDTPPNAKNPFAGPGSYPSIVFLHQQRLGFASSDSQPLTVWLSQAGNHESMAASIPPSDDDAIEVTLSSTDASRILWCVSDRSGLAVGTASGEWLLHGSEGTALTPKNPAFEPQTYYGSQPGLSVLRAGATLLFVQAGGRAVREFGYNFSADRYESGDLSLLAKHILARNPVVDWAWQGEPYGIAWLVLADGTLAGLTYLREHDVIAWHRHETAGRVEDICAVPGDDGTAIWLHVIRNNVRYVERLLPFDDYAPGDGEECLHADGEAGLPFTAVCQPMLPVQALQNGPAWLRVNKINAIKAAVWRSHPFTAAVGDMRPLPVPARPAGFAREAWWAVPLGAGWRENERLTLTFEGAGKATILGILATVEVAEMSGSRK